MHCYNPQLTLFGLHASHTGSCCSLCYDFDTHDAFNELSKFSITSWWHPSYDNLWVSSLVCVQLRSHCVHSVIEALHASNMCCQLTFANSTIHQQSCVWISCRQQCFSCLLSGIHHILPAKDSMHCTPPSTQELTQHAAVLFWDVNACV